MQLHIHPVTEDVAPVVARIAHIIQKNVEMNKIENVYFDSENDVKEFIFNLQNLTKS